MRKPKAVGKRKAAEPTPVGGRAWSRVQQFALARGITVVGPAEQAKATPRRAAKRPAR